MRLPTTHAPLDYREHNNGYTSPGPPHPESKMPIAIVGMSCRFPGDATDLERLWQLCAEGRSAWSEIPEDRFKHTAFFHPQPENRGTSNVLGGHFLKDDVSLFDASFFNFSSEVASSMDPQFRLQLESTFEALEGAGIPISKLAATQTSVFAALCFRDYHDSLMRDPDTLPRLFMTGNGAAMMSNRLSHFFDLRGASVTVDTGCSSALAALHLACQGLRAGDASMAIVGGANVMLNPDWFQAMSSLGFLGADGKSNSFDCRAAGYGRGEGVATIILKPLEHALRDGDPIRAIIRETALNQDGKTSTITSPSQEAQEAIIRTCYRNAGLDPLSTSYVEAHGTGTKSGDPIEGGAIAAVLGINRPVEKPLFIGSVKSNIGHLEAASGLAAIIKVALAFEKGFIPPSINFEQPNPAVQLDKWNLKVPTKLEAWPAGQIKRASVNNFGYGGLNAHVIMDEAVPMRRPSIFTNGYSTTNGHTVVNGHGIVNKHSQNGDNHLTLEQSKVFILSAKDERAAQVMISNMKEKLKLTEEKHEDLNFEDLAYTLGQRRSLFSWIAATSAGNLPELIKAFDDAKPRYNAGVPRVGFVFNGQGAQWHAMGRELLGSYPVFEESICEADICLQDLGASFSLHDELLRDEQTTRVNEPLMSLSLCTAVQVSLVRLLRSWGIIPTAVTGHSSGEVGAAYAAGAIDLREAMVIVYTRGKLTTESLKHSGVRGGMLAVALSQDKAESYLSNLTSGRAIVACVNSPSSVTISGDLPAIAEVESRITANKIFARRLQVQAAYHSHHMQPLAKAYRSALQLNLKQDGDFEDIIYTSPVTGERIDSAQQLGAEHWVKNMVQPVLFAQSLYAMCVGTSKSKSNESEQLIDTIIEIGPHSALAGPIRQTLALPALKDLGISYGSCLVRGKDAVKTMQDLACSLLMKGTLINMCAVNFPRGKEQLHVISNLPSYPWNHSIGHWAEPRLNKSYRNRKHAPHDLLGSLVIGANSLAPTWRHIIRPAEIPWVRDHLVQSDIIYPGAGCISMAIEALRQSLALKSEDKAITGYNLRDIQIMKALVIPDTSEGIEIQLNLRDCSDKIIDASTWQEFNIYSVRDDGTWTEHCKGLISAVFPAHDNAEGFTDSTKELTKADISQQAGTCTKPVDINDLFKSLHAMGINHGPLFQNLISIHSGQGKSLTTFEVADSASLMPAKFQHDHLIHPTTLDSVFQAAYSALPQSTADEMGAALPRFIKTMFVSQDIHSDAKHRFEVLTEVHRHSPQGFDVSMTTVDEAQYRSPPLLVIEGMHYQSLGGNLAEQKPMDDARLCMTMQWDHHLSLMQPEQLKSFLVLPPSPTEAVIIEDLKRVTYHIIHDTLAALSDEDIQTLDWHQQLFYGWMKLQDIRAAQDELAPNSSKWVRASEGVKQLLFDKVASASKNGEMLCRIGEELTSILRKEVSPLELMLENKLLYSFYENALRFDRSLDQVGKIVKLFAYQNPRGKVLEIGGGTGACTGTVLRALGGGGDPLTGTPPRFTHYDYTDVSLGFMDMAREKFGAWGDLITYSKLDIEQDPAEQSFELASYDLIIACQVLHATKSIVATMKNVRKLLKPGGTLVVVETTQDALDIQLIFGTLPGWFLSEEKERKYSPNLTVDHWKRVLTQTGFSGLDVQVQDCEDDNTYAMSVIASTAVAEGPPEYPSEVVVVYADSAPPTAWVNNLKASLQGVIPTTFSVESLKTVNANGKVCIIIGEIERPILYHVDEKRFKAVSNLLNEAGGVLWVTVGATMACERPENGLHTGLLRALRVEDNSKRYISLDLDPNRKPWSSENVTAIANVFKFNFNYAQDKSLSDFEYAERNSLIHVPRIRDDVFENKATAADTVTVATPEQQPFHQPGRELRLHVESPGSLDSIIFKDDVSAGEKLADDFVEIKPEAFGLNFRDIMVAMGQLQETTMGFECSGFITQLGPNPSHDFKVGDRVCALMTKGHWASSVRVHSTCVGRIPESMSFEVAASIPMVFVTAHYSLFHAGRLEKGETTLIHAATGGVGQAAIILAQHVEAEIFVTVGTKEKREFIKTTYGIREDHIFSSRDPSFATRVMAATGGKGVDVVLNSLSGRLLLESWNCVAMLGRFVEIGKRDIQLNKNLEMEPFGRAISFSAVDLIHLATHKGPVISRLLAEVLRLLDEKSIQAVKPISIFPISDLQRAFRLMQAGKHLGKIIITPSKGDLVKVLPQSLPLKLDARVSYLIVGGMGGIGRSITRWMLQKGAKNLIILSRSATSQKAQSFLDELDQVGCNVVILECDVANKLALARIMKDCARDLPPVRGVIQAAMVLQDSVFERMPYSKWEAAIRPKVQASWNLHEQFVSNGLEFFIMLSSITGIVGNTSQSNYAAGGTFQDALARHRTAKGLPAVSIDLGGVKSVGYVAETKGVEERLLRMGIAALEEEQVMNVIEAAIKRPLRHQDSSQIITGISPFSVSDGVIWREELRFQSLIKTKTSSQLGSGNSSTKDAGKFDEILTGSLSWGDAVDYIANDIVKKLSEMFLISEKEIDTSMPMAKYGVDSLVAVELRNWLVPRARADISIFDLLQSPSLVSLAAKVAAKSSYLAQAKIVAP